MGVVIVLATVVVPAARIVATLGVVVADVAIEVDGGRRTRRNSCNHTTGFQYTSSNRRIVATAAAQI
eukprot:871841-Pyramimonas_sp.AAC.1